MRYGNRNAAIADQATQLIACLSGGVAAAIVCGTDLVEMAQFSRDLKLGGDRFLHRIYTEDELTFCGGRADRLATRFAGKEAVAKALGTGIRGLSWSEIEILSAAQGQPRIILHCRAASRAAHLGISTWVISLSHSPSSALAFVVGLGLIVPTGMVLPVDKSQTQHNEGGEPHARQ